MGRQRKNIELWLALFTILAISLVYVLTVVWFNEIPGASGFIGHGIGIAGFLLMLMTETLYTLRKRSRDARWGRMSAWLNFHIFTGLVGPFMVLLHSSWKFHGLAGMVMLLTAVVVVSGFIGRYIYTAVPRSAEGAVISAGELEAEIATMEFELQRLLAAQKGDNVSQLVKDMEREVKSKGSQSLLFWGRFFQDWDYRIKWRRAIGSLSQADRADMVEMENLLKTRRKLHLQVRSLVMARRLLSLWHSVHVPIGIILFTAAFVHIIAAFYYATLLR